MNNLVKHTDRIEELTGALSELLAVVCELNLMNIDDGIAPRLMKAHSKAKVALGGDGAKKERMNQLRREADRIECELRGISLEQFLSERASR